MKGYPSVLDELETLRQVAAGRSLARYGDGEIKLVRGGAAKAQGADGVLQRRLRGILRESGACLVGIPNVHSATPKRELWRDQAKRALPYLDRDRQYGSAFVTRPDSAPWVDVPEYWALLESLWVGQDVTLVRGSTKSLTAEALNGAGRVTEIVGPRQHAWADYQSLLERIGTPTRAILCLGPAATVMAVDLAARGVHAIDLGHVGLFLKKHRRGLPMVVTTEDKKVPA